MTDWPLIVARLALYGDLGLLFGSACFALYARPALTPRGMARLWAALSAGGIVLALLGFALIVAGMSGTSLGGLDPALAWTLFGQTAVGAALAARLAALLLALIIALFPALAAQHVLADDGLRRDRARQPRLERAWRGRRGDGGPAPSRRGHRASAGGERLARRARHADRAGLAARPAHRRARRQPLMPPSRASARSARSSSCSFSRPASSTSPISSALTG